MDISAFIEIAKELHVLGIKITKDGELINEWYSEEECRRNIYSAAKSFTSCAPWHRLLGQQVLDP